MNCLQDLILSRRMMSPCTFFVAVAVSASVGTPGMQAACRQRS